MAVRVAVGQARLGPVELGGAWYGSFRYGRWVKARHVVARYCEVRSVTVWQARSGFVEFVSFGLGMVVCGSWGMPWTGLASRGASR